MGDEAAATPSEQQAQREQRAEPKHDPAFKTVVESYETKVGQLGADLSQERAKVKRMEDELKTERSTRLVLELKEKRRGALEGALDKLGEDFTIGKMEMDNLRKVVDALPDSETLADTVASLVELAKRPVKPESKNASLPFTGQPTNSDPGTGAVPDKKATDFTAQELARLYREDPARYEKVMAERRQELKAKPVF